MHLVNGYDLQITKFQRLHYILRGIKRVKGVSTRTRLPITLDHLKLFHRILHSRTSPTHDETMIWAAISLAFFGFLRIGETTCSGPYNSSTNLCRSDVSFHNEKRGDHEVFLQLRIKASKTDNHWQQFWYILSSKGPSNLPFTCVNGLCGTIVLLFKRCSFIT